MKFLCNLLRQRLGKVLVLLGFAAVAAQSHAWVTVTTPDNRALVTGTEWWSPWEPISMNGFWGTAAQISSAQVWGGGKSVMTNTDGAVFYRMGNCCAWVQLNIPSWAGKFKKVVISPDGKLIYGIANGVGVSNSSNFLFVASTTNFDYVRGFNPQWAFLRPNVKDVTRSANYVYIVSTDGSISADGTTQYFQGYGDTNFMGLGAKQIPAGGYLTSISSGTHPSGTELIWGVGGDGNIWLKGENPSDGWFPLPGSSNVRTGNWVEVAPDPSGYKVWARDKWNGLFLIDYTTWYNPSSTWQNARVTSISAWKPKY